MTSGVPCMFEGDLGERVDLMIFGTVISQVVSRFYNLKTCRGSYQGMEK
jgi:hypothetical protein